MKAETKLKYAILELAAIWDDKTISTTLTEDEVEDLWDEADCLQDATNEIRCSGIITGLDCDYSRHYESEAVAVKCPNGDWVGFTHWYGGGKWGDPDSIDWMDKAYNLDCVEEQKMVTIQTFSKKT